MTTNSPAEKPADRLEPRAQQHAHDAHYLGTDGDGAHHFWSIYHQLVVVFETPAADAKLVTIPTHERSTGTDIKNPGDWAAYIQAQRGEWERLLLSTSTVDQAAAVIDA